MSHSNSREFANHVLTECGISVRWMNQQPEVYRFREVFSAVERLIRYGVNNYGVERDYDTAAHGIKWAIQSGRLSGEIELSIRGMKTRELLSLIHEVRMQCACIGDVPRFLINRHFQQQEKASC